MSATDTLDPKALARAKWCLAARRVAPGAAARLLGDVAAARAGELLLARVERLGAVPGLLLATGRTARLYHGDLVVVACGACDGTGGAGAAEIEAEGAALLTAGGLAGREAPASGGPAPTVLVPLARLADAAGRPLDVAGPPLGPGPRPEGLGVLLVVGVTGPRLRKRTRTRTFGQLRVWACLSSFPQPVEAHGGRSGVVGGVAWVAVAEVVLDQAQVVAAVGQREAAGVAQHVGPDAAEAGALADAPEQVVHRLARHGLAPLGDEEPGQIVVAHGQPALDGAQLVARDWVLDRQATLEPSHPEPALGEVDVAAPERHGFGDAQAVAEEHEHEQVVARPVPAGAGGLEQALDLGRAEEVASAFVVVGCGGARHTLDLLPSGHGPCASPRRLIRFDRWRHTLHSWRVV